MAGTFKKSFYWAVYLIIVACPSTIQLNAQVIHMNEMDSLWHAKITATGLYTSGNSPRSLFTNKFRLTKVGNTFGLFSNAVYQYGTVSKKKIVTYNDYRFDNSVLLKPHRRLVPFVRFYQEKNLLRKVNFRNEVAMGVLFKLLAKKGQAINILSAVINQQTKYDRNIFEHIDNGGSYKRNVWKGVVGINGNNTLIDNKLTAEYRILGLQAFQIRQDYALLVDVTFDLKVTRKFSFTMNGFYTYENIELVGILPNEFQLTYGLSITL